MNAVTQKGISVSRLLVIITIVGLVLAGGIFASFSLVAQGQKNNAVSFGMDFVSDINNQRQNESYEKLGDEYRKDPGYYYTWVNWVGEFERGDISVSSDPTTIERTSSVFSSPVYELIFDTDGSLSLGLEVTNDTNGWYVKNYRMQ